MAATTAAVVAAGATVKSSIDARKASKRAAGIQEQAGAAQQAEFETVREGLEPFRAGGLPAFEQQRALSGAAGPEAQALAFQQFQEDPGTQFLREQGLRLIEAGAGATGGLGGGQRLRELTKFSQGLALQDLSSRFDRLGAVTGTGLRAAQAIGGVSGQVAGAIGAQGAAAASGILGAQQATAQGTQQLIGQLPGLVDAFSSPSTSQNVQFNQPGFAPLTPPPNTQFNQPGFTPLSF